MELLKKILDLPVIVPGALGSLLFYACFELAKRCTGAVARLLASYSTERRAEALWFDFAHAQIDVSQSTLGTKDAVMLICIFTALNRLLHALIYVCFGLICQSITLEPMAVVSFVFAVTYLFRALRAVQVSLKHGRDDEQRAQSLEAAQNRLQEFIAQQKAGNGKT